MFYIEENKRMYITRSDDGVVEMNSLVDAEGKPYELQPGDILTLTVKENPTDETAIFSTSSVPGSNRLVIRSEDTRDAEIGKYSVDVQITTADGLRFTVWPMLEGSERTKKTNLKNFIIMPEVTSV